MTLTFSSSSESESDPEEESDEEESDAASEQEQVQPDGEVPQGSRLAIVNLDWDKVTPVGCAWHQS